MINANSARRGGYNGALSFNRMQAPQRQTRSQLMALFGDLGFHPRGDLGQNFLIDLNLIEFIVEKADIGADDVVLEVGAGTGGLTTFLAQRAGHVVAVEVDPRVHGVARGAVAEFDNVTLLLTDVLATKSRLAPMVTDALSRELRAGRQRRLKLVANLPYSVATPVISNLVASDLDWQAMLVTIQWELAERLRARPGTNDYGALSVWLQSQCRIDVLKKLGPQVFWPRPQVDSAIVQLVPDGDGRARLGDRDFFHDFVRRVFAQRRKLLRGVLSSMYRDSLTKNDIDGILRKQGCPDTTRAEELPVETLVRLASALRDAIMGESGPGT